MTESSDSQIVMNDNLTAKTQWTDFSLLAQHADRRVYRARRCGRWFVLKTYANPTLEHFHQLRKEFESGYQLDSPYIVQTLNLEQIAELGWCIVIEYIDGTSLSDYLTTQPDKTTRQCLLHQLMEAIQYLHSRQMVHLDLKPSNILVTRNGHNIKLIDFGLSRLDSDSASLHTSGTVGYMAPEQAAGLPTDCRTDIYALGKIISLLCPQYKNIARKCTREQPEQRFASCEALQVAILRHDRYKKWWPLIVGVICLMVSLTLSLWLTLRPDPRQVVIQRAQELMNEQYQLICSQPPTSMEEYHSTLLMFFNRSTAVRDSVAATITDETLRADFINAAVIKTGELSTTYSEIATGVERE